MPIFTSLKCDPKRSIHPTASKCGSAANNVRIAMYVTLALQCLVLLSASLFEAQNGTKIGYEFLVLQVLIFFIYLSGNPESRNTFRAYFSLLVIALLQFMLATYCPVR